MESLYGLILKIQEQHSPELRSFATNMVKSSVYTGYTDEHNMLQATFYSRQATRNRRNRPR